MYPIISLKFDCESKSFILVTPFVPKNPPTTPPINPPKKGTGITACPNKIPANVLPTEPNTVKVAFPI